jgi:hypothetical protein
LEGLVEKEVRGDEAGLSGSCLGLGDFSESLLSLLSFSFSLSLSFLKMWASWTIGGQGIFFFLMESKDDEGGRSAESEGSTGFNHGFFHQKDYELAIIIEFNSSSSY